MKHIDDFFREKLGNYTETPPADVWDELDSRLDTLAPPPAGRTYRWVWHAAMVSLILLLLSVSLYRKTTGNGNESQKTALNESTNTTNITDTKATNNTATNQSPAADNNSAASNSNNDNKSGNVSGNDNTVNNYPAATTTAANRSESKAQAVNAGNTNNTAKNRTASVAQKNKKLAGNMPLKANSKGNTYHNGTGAKSGPNAEEDQAENEYNSSAANDAAKAKATTAAEEKSVAAEKPKDDKPAATKKADDTRKNEPAKNDNKKKSSKPWFSRLEAGVKAGYETGFSSGTANKYVIAPYLQYKLSHKISLMLQPAIKYANLSSKNISQQSYYQKNDDGRMTNEDPEVYGRTLGSTFVIDSYTTKYTATESHDSIVKSYHYGGTYMEFELPVMLKYNLSKKTSVYGGVSAVYSQMTNVKENTFTASGIVRTADITKTTTAYPTPADAPKVGDLVKYNGTPYTNYNGPITAPKQGQLRVGYMLGFTYEAGKRLLFDALTQISPNSPIMKGGYDLSTPLSSPYFRLSVGYKLTK